MKTRHRIQFPPANIRELRQDEVYFYLLDEGSRERIRLHDYARMFSIPGLYEQVVHERLKCQSPVTVTDVLRSSVSRSRQTSTNFGCSTSAPGTGSSANS